MLFTYKCYEDVTLAGVEARVSIDRLVLITAAVTDCVGTSIVTVTRGGVEEHVRKSYSAQFMKGKFALIMEFVLGDNVGAMKVLKGLTAELILA